MNYRPSIYKDVGTLTVPCILLLFSGRNFNLLNKNFLFKIFKNNKSKLRIFVVQDHYVLLNKSTMEVCPRSY